MSTSRAAGWIALFGALVLVAFQVMDSGESNPPPENKQAPAAAGKERTAQVLRAVDGDTILVRDRGTNKTERVRYIGVDTPESVKPNAPVDCFGHEASNFNRSLVQGKLVRLVPDHEAHDKYGRSLAFVYVDDTFVQAELLRGGYARTLEIEPNTSKAPYFARLERVAIRTNKGLWRACDR